MNKYIILFVLPVLLSSCFKDRIELDLNEENSKLVVSAWITNLNEPQVVTLSKTVNYLGNQNKNTVSGASVTISDVVESYVLVENEPGKYYLPNNWEARVGDLYTLQISYEGEEYIASHLMRQAPEIENPTFVEDDSDSTGLYEPVFAFQETPGKGDGYYIVNYLKGLSNGSSISDGGYVDDEFVDGEYFEEVTLGEESALYTIGDTAVLELYSIGKETTRFLSDIESEVFSDGPFDAPSSNVRTNVSNGAVGYFIVSGAKRVEIVVE